MGVLTASRHTVLGCRRYRGGSRIRPPDHWADAPRVLRRRRIVRGPPVARSPPAEKCGFHSGRVGVQARTAPVKVIPGKARVLSDILGEW